MTGARVSTLASLRRTISRIEAGGTSQDVARVALGHAAADAMLQGGLIRGALHEVFALESRHTASATGFVAGLAGRLTGRRPLLWIRHDFIEAEVGQVAMNGFRELAGAARFANAQGAYARRSPDGLGTHRFECGRLLRATRGVAPVGVSSPQFEHPGAEEHFAVGVASLPVSNFGMKTVVRDAGGCRCPKLNVSRRMRLSGSFALPAVASLAIPDAGGRAIGGGLAPTLQGGRELHDLEGVAAGLGLLFEVLVEDRDFKSA